MDGLLDNVHDSVARQESPPAFVLVVRPESQTILQAERVFEKVGQLLLLHYPPLRDGERAVQLDDSLLCNSTGHTQEITTMPDLLHAIPVAAGQDAVLKAISTSEGLRNWWTSDCDAEPTIGHVNVFRFGSRTEFHFRVDQLDENGLQWTCVEADKVPDEWVGTTMTFKLTPEGSGTRIDFVHGGWQRVDGYIPICNTTWGELMYRLKDYVEGNPRGPRFS